MKRKMSLFLLLCITLGSTNVVRGQEFTDMSNSWATDVVYRWTEYNVLSGYEDGTFRPSAYTTRAEAAGIIDKIMHYDVVAENSFSDIKGDEWYANSILKNVAAGNLSGYDGKFRPKDFITRQELAALICNAFNIEVVLGPTTFADDYNISDWAKGSVKALEVGGYINSGLGNDFAPTSNITRAELVALLDNIADLDKRCEKSVHVFVNEN